MRKPRQKPRLLFLQQTSQSDACHHNRGSIAPWSVTALAAMFSPCGYIRLVFTHGRASTADGDPPPVAAVFGTTFCVRSEGPLQRKRVHVLYRGPSTTLVVCGDSLPLRMSPPESEEFPRVLRSKPAWAKVQGYCPGTVRFIRISFPPLRAS